MRIYISADGEGISGTVSSKEMHESGRDYERFRRWMTQDVNAAIHGAFRAGATEVIVNDAHWTMINLLYEELDARADVIRGSNKELSMISGIEGADAALFIGYHAKVGHSDGVANETMVGFEMYEIRMNGQPVGEMEINAALAGHFNVPVAMVSGDDCLEREAKAFFGPEIEAAVVKYSIDRWSARCLSLQRAHEVIERTAFRAVKNIRNFRPIKVERPVEFEIEWTSTSECNKSSAVPGAYRKSPRVVAYRGQNILDAWRGISACLSLGGSAANPI